MSKNGKTEKTEIVETQEHVPSPLGARPTFMRGQGLGQTAELKSNRLELPRLMLLQGMSPLVQEGKAKQGNFWHTILEQEIEPPLTVAVICIRYRFVLMEPKTEKNKGLNRKVFARANDGINWDKPNQSFEVELDGGRKVVWRTGKNIIQDKLDQWGTSDPETAKRDPNKVIPPAAQEYQNIYCKSPFRPELGVFVISLTRTFTKAGRKLNSALHLEGSNDDYFSKYVDVGTYLENASQGSSQRLYNWKFRRHPEYIENEEEYNSYLELFKHFKDLDVDIKGEGDEDDDTPPFPPDDPKATYDPKAETRF